VSAFLADFRREILTNQHSQLVLMSIEPGDEIGEETHDTVPRQKRSPQSTIDLLLLRAAEVLRVVYLKTRPHRLP
jgi:hypothetical protein